MQVEELQSPHLMLSIGYHADGKLKCKQSIIQSVSRSVERPEYEFVAELARYLPSMPAEIPECHFGHLRARAISADIALDVNMGSKRK